MEVRVHVVYGFSVLAGAHGLQLGRRIVHAIVSVQIIKGMFVTVLGNEARTQLGRGDIILLLNSDCNALRLANSSPRPHDGLQTWRARHASIVIVVQGIRPSFLLWPFHKGTLSTVGRAELTGRGAIDLACHLAGSAEIARPILARLVAARTWLHGRAQFQTIEEIGGRQ